MENSTVLYQGKETINGNEYDVSLEVKTPLEVLGNTPTEIKTEELVQPVPDATASQLGADNQSNKASVVLSLEEALNSELDGLTAKKEQIKKKNKLLREKLLLNPEYHEADDSVKKEQAVRKLAKMKAIAADEQLALLTNEVRELRLDNKFHQMSIQDYLIALEKETGLTTFASSSGDIIEFEKVAKIKTKVQ